MVTALLRERYEPLEVVGRGGEGEVIRALDHLHDRYVALKVRPVSGDGSRASLLSEARMLLSLSPHPGLPLVREDFFLDGRYFIAMDWIEGRDLDALLTAEGRPGLEPTLAIDYLAQAAEALEHLHTHDPPVVHGDVKPANLILTASGRVVLVDFGLSSSPTDDPRRAGTAGFVAPEVAAGARPTPAADVYSLAATAVALLTGGVPRWGAIEAERVAALERIVRRSLATDPQRRDPSARAFVDSLRRWWGSELPSGTVTLVLADADEDPFDSVVRAHRGHAVPPAGDGPLLAAFASAQDGFDTALELAPDRVAVVTEETEPRAGTYQAATATRLLELSEPGRVVVDAQTAAALDGRLPPEIGLAELPAGWAVVAPGLSVPQRAETCPYRGLMVYGSEDGDLFFGREEVVASILEQLHDAGFMAIVGASGTGKSSVARAGLVPAFPAAVVMTPGSDPAAELERALAPGPPSLLVVDQFEELFTLCREEADRAVFVDALMDLRETPVVVVLRADFYARCADYPRLAAAVAEHQHLLGAMSAGELRRAIEGPARTAGLRLEAGLVETVLADVEGEPGALPLLSHALYESWARRDGRVLTTAGYREAGGVRAAIARTAEEVFLSCSPEEQAVMRRLLLRLTEPGEGTEDTRTRVPLTELAQAAASVLERLAAARLVVVGDDAVEIAHEALIREWPRLRGWLAEDREALRTLRQLTSAARAWEEAGREEGDLYRGPRLAAAAELTGELSRVEREFLDASATAQGRELTSARRRARRLRILLAVVATALVAAVIAGAFALVQRENARHTAVVAQSGRLAAQSRQAAADRPDLALLLALEAGRLDDSIDARSALLGALEHASRVRAWLQPFDAPVNAPAFSPDGRLLATVTEQGTTLWNTATWRPAGPLLRSKQGGWGWADFSPDGRTLAIAGGKGRVELWDVSTRKELRELRDPIRAALAVVRFSPDGRVLAAGGQDTNHFTLWDVASGRVIGEPIVAGPPGESAQWLAFSPDSERIAAPGGTGAVGIWDVATGRRVGKPLAIGAEVIDDALFADGGRTIVASDDSGAVTLVDVASGRRLRPPLSVGDKPAGSLALSPDGRLLAAASFEGPVFVWDVESGEPYGAPLVAGTSPVNGVAFSPDGRTLVSSHLRSAVVWNVSGAQAIGAPLGGPTDLITDVAFSPDGRRLAAARFDRPTVVYDTATRRATVRIPNSSIVSAVAFDPDGRRVAVGTIGGTVGLFDATSGAAVSPPTEAGSAVWQVAFSPDGRLLAIAVDPNGVDGFYRQRRQGTVQLLDVESRRPVGRTIAPGAGSVLALAFSPDGRLLATASYAGRLDLWDVATQSRHGKRMAVADDGLPGVAFDPSGRLVAAGGATGPVRVWQVADQRPVYPPLAGHTGPVTGVAFDRTGSFLASSSVLGGTRLWDAATGFAYGDELVASPAPEPNVELPFMGLRNAFSPDGTRLAVAGVGVRAMLWDVDPAAWRRRACAIAGRNLSREEWNLYLPSGTPYRATCPEWPGG